MATSSAGIDLNRAFVKDEFAFMLRSFLKAEPRFEIKY